MEKRSDYWVYVLRNREGRFYIGLTEDVVNRVEQHNAGESKWTRTRRPWKLVWQEGPMPLSDARKLEALLKRQKGGIGSYNLTGL